MCPALAAAVTVTRPCRSKCFTMHVRNWVASAKIRLDEKRKARAAEEAAGESADAAASQASAVAAGGGGAGLRKRNGKTKKT